MEESSVSVKNQKKNVFFSTSSSKDEHDSFWYVLNLVFDTPKALKIV